MDWTLQEVEKIIEAINQDLKIWNKTKKWHDREGRKELKKQVHWRIQDSVTNQVNNKNKLEIITDTECQKRLVPWPKQLGRC